MISIYFTLLSTPKTPTSPILTTLQTPSCIAHIPCASRALRLPRKFKIRLHLHRQLSQVDFLERLVLVSFRFSSFSILYESLQIQWLGCFQPSRAIVNTRLSGTLLGYSHNISHSSLRRLRLQILALLALRGWIILYHIRGPLVGILPYLVAKSWF